jgi:hypothetical protein
MKGCYPRNQSQTQRKRRRLCSYVSSLPVRDRNDGYTHNARNTFMMTSSRTLTKILWSLVMMKATNPDIVVVAHLKVRIMARRRAIVSVSSAAPYRAVLNLSSRRHCNQDWRRCRALRSSGHSVLERLAHAQWVGQDRQVDVIHPGSPQIQSSKVK